MCLKNNSVHVTISALRVVHLLFKWSLLSCQTHAMGSESVAKKATAPHISEAEIECPGIFLYRMVIFALSPCRSVCGDRAREGGWSVGGDCVSL